MAHFRKSYTEATIKKNIESVFEIVKEILKSVKKSESIKINKNIEKIKKLNYQLANIEKENNMMIFNESLRREILGGSGS